MWLKIIFQKMYNQVILRPPKNHEIQLFFLVSPIANVLENSTTLAVASSLGKLIIAKIS